MIITNENINKNNIHKLIDIEISSIEAYVPIQNNLNTQLLLFLKNFFGNIETEKNSSIPNNIYDCINNGISKLKELNSNIHTLNSLISELKNLKSIPLDSTYLYGKIVSYNNNYNLNMPIIYKSNSQIQEFIYSLSFINISEYIFPELLNIKVSDAATNTYVQPTETNIKTYINPTITNNTAITKTIIAESQDTNNTETTTEIIEEKQYIDNTEKNTPIIEKVENINNTKTYTENTLIISDLKEKVILPYTIENLNNTLENNKNKYRNIDEIIEQEYTLPIKNYRFSAVSRFREAYKLIAEKEKGSKVEALQLATELFSNFSLHPAIITACKNLNELDIYLSCLEYEELEDFSFFKIQFESAPRIIEKLPKLLKYNFLEPSTSKNTEKNI